MLPRFDADSCPRVSLALVPPGPVRDNSLACTHRRTCPGTRTIPTGLCYQRLTDDGSSFNVHGLVAVHLQGSWHRQDPRGNKPGVDAQFSLTTEQLAWPVATELGEHDYPQLLVSPHPDVVRALRGATDALALCRGGLPSHL